MTHPTYVVVPARPQDLPLLPAIELDAARLLIPYAPGEVLLETTSRREFKEAREAGLLWAALVNDTPVGLAHAKLIEPGTLHLDEIDVRPAFGRRGIGRALVETVCAAARDRGLLGVTLSTFRDVPFNYPFYTAAGFREIPLAQLSATLLAIRDSEERRGLDPARRVVMRRELDGE